MLLNTNINYQYNDKDIMKRRLHLQETPSDVLDLAHNLTNKHFLPFFKNKTKINQKRKRRIDLNDMLDYDVVNI